MIRPAALPAVLLWAGLAAPAQADANVVWTRLDVNARLDNQGRLQVVETHQLRLARGGGFALFREFGLGADQAIALRSLTRVNADGSELALLDGEVGEDATRFRYYPRGHAYFRVPELDAGSAVAYRFEYELVRAVSPAWGFAAGPDPLVESPGLVSPWKRARELLGDWRAARPAASRRYFLDHCVLFPSRDGPGYEVRRVDYRLEFDSAWRRVVPDAPLATVQEDVQYRVRLLFEYLADGRAPEAAWREAAARWLAVAALPVVGLLLWLATLAVEALATRGAPPLEHASIRATLREVAPEALPGLMGDSAEPPGLGEVFARLSAEGKLAVELAPSRRADREDDGREAQVRLRRLVRPDRLPAHERAFLAHFFPDGDESSDATLRAAYREEGFDPASALASLMQEPPPAPPRSVVAWIALALGVYGLVLQLRSLSDPDFVPIVVLANLVPFALGAGWPRGWWHAGRPRRGLLVPLFVLGLGALALQLSVNRPLPPEAWIGTSVVVLACQAATLRGSRMPTGGPYAFVRELARIRRFAQLELRGPNPRLDDAWIAHLQALGLEGELERWRARHGGARRLELQAAGGPQGARFTGRRRAPVSWPSDWTAALHVESESERQAHQHDADEP